MHFNRSFFILLLAGLVANQGCDAFKGGNNELKKIPRRENVPEEKKRPGPPRLTALELCKEYSKNPKKAGERFWNKRIELSGKVVNRGTELNSHFLYIAPNPSIHLPEPDYKISIKCEFPESAYNDLVVLHGGKSVTLTGKVTSFENRVLRLKNCKVN